jgi:hypothetical protein
LKKRGIFIQFLIEENKSKTKISHIPDYCSTMNDGEMGSISFDLHNSATYGSDLIQVEYLDLDEILVIITLSIDTNGNLYELEFWKVDFCKLNKYPEPGDILKFYAKNN